MNFLVPTPPPSPGLVGWFLEAPSPQKLKVFEERM